MSKRTFIPKWDPRSCFEDARSTRRGGGFRTNGGRRSRAEHSDLDSTQGHTQQVLGGQVRWYGTHHDRSEDRTREGAGRIYEGRLTQRVGMFRNAKQSQVIYNDVSSAVRRNINRDLEHLVAPEEDVEWTRKPPPHGKRNSAQSTSQEADCSSPTRRRTRNRADDAGSRRVRCYKEYFKERERVDRQRDNGRTDYESGYVPAMTRRRSSRSQDGHADRGEDVDRYSPPPRRRRESREIHGMGHRDNRPREEGRSRPERTHGFDPRRRVDHIAPQTDDVESDPSGSDNVIQRSEILRQHERVLRTPTLKEAPCQPQLPSPATVVFPALKLCGRISSSLSTLPLQEDNKKMYDSLAVALLSDSIKSSTEFETTANKQMMSSMMNQTHQLEVPAVQDYSEDDEGNPACGHDYLFRPDTPPMEYVQSSSPPPTPLLERAFNQTMRAHSILDVIPSEPRQLDINQSNLLGPVTEQSVGSFRDPILYGQPNSSRSHCSQRSSVNMGRSGFGSVPSSSLNCSISSGMEVVSCRSTIDNQNHSHDWEYNALDEPHNTSAASVDDFPWARPSPIDVSMLRGNGPPFF